MSRSKKIRRCGWSLSVALGLIAMPAFAQEAAYRLNAGGSWYTDTAGQLWEPDSGYRDYGFVGLTSSSISGTLDDQLYQSERYGVSWQPEFAYHLPVPAGTYTVRLHFAEIYSGITPANPRVFDVFMEGVPALTGYDILSSAGFATAVVEEFEVDVADTELDIEFVAVQENPKISAIEVLESAGPGPGPELNISPPQLVFGDVTVGQEGWDSAGLTNNGDDTLTITAISVGGANPAVFAVEHDSLPISLAPGETAALGITFAPSATGTYSASVAVSSNDPAGVKTLPLSGRGIGEGVAVWRVNAGGGTFTDPEGNVWQADTGLFNTGSTFSTSSSIAGTINDALYRTERYDIQSLPEMMYSLPVTPGVYTVNLHFAEIWFTNVNQRVFDVLAEGQLLLNDYDIIATAGRLTAVVETFDVEVQDGTLNIQFVHVTENPKISGIEVLTQQQDVRVQPQSVDLGTVSTGETSSPQSVTISNGTAAGVQLEALTITGANADEFDVGGAPALPYAIAAGGTLGINVVFSPVVAGVRQAALNLTVSGGRQFTVALSGVGDVTPPPSGAVYRVNAGGGAYTDPQGQIWQTDAGFFNTGSTFSTTSAISGTTSDTLYQTERWDGSQSPEMTYSFPLNPGAYVVRLHFAEIFSGITGPGQRVFDVRMEGQPVLSNFDIYAEAGPLAALIKQFNVSVTDGTLQIQFVHGVDNPKVSAIEVLGESTVTTSVSVLDWGSLVLNVAGPIKMLYLNNNGTSDVTVTSLSFLVGQGTGQGFRANINGSTYYGQSSDVTYPVNFTIAAGGSKQISVAFTPVTVSDNVVALTFSGGFGSVAVELRGSGVSNGQDPYVHAVIEKPPYFIDYNWDGWEVVYIRGDLSYTSESGRSIVGYQWVINGATVSTAANFSYNFPRGYTTIMLTVWDNSIPAKSNSTTSVMYIPAPDSVPGSLVKFYDARGADPVTLLDSVPATADYGTKMSTVYIGGGTSTIVPTDYTGNVMVQFLAQLDLAAGTYQFAASGGSGSRLLLNGSVLTGPRTVSAGRYLLDARFAIPSVSYLPVRVDMSVNGGGYLLVPAEIVTHSQDQLKPIINTMPTGGSRAGGYQIAIYGMGFTPLNQIVVHWGGTTIANQFLTVQSSAVRFTAPAGTGTINVTVENPYGTSNIRTFSYY